MDRDRAARRSWQCVQSSAGNFLILKCSPDAYDTIVWYVRAEKDMRCPQIYILYVPRLLNNDFEIKCTKKRYSRDAV